MSGQASAIPVGACRFVGAAGAALRLRHGGQDQVAQKLRVVLLEHGGVDLDRADHAAAVGGHPDQAAAGGRLDGPTGQLRLQLLKPALHLLAELKELLKIRHAFW